MTDQHTGGGVDEPDPTEPVIKDKRRIDPETGTVKPEFRGGGRHAAPVPDDHEQEYEDVEQQATRIVGEAFADELQAAKDEAAERVEDLQRLQAEYVNYRKRVDRDRDVARELAIAEVVEAMIPVLDDIDLARQHEELTGPFGAVSEKVEATLGRFGAERYGAVGEEFDPTVHEALMHSTSAEVTTTSVVQVLQPGYRIGDRILRAARVAVADPE